LVINLKKCFFGKASITFLGHEVSKNVIRPLPEKVKEIAAISPPADVEALDRFLGMVNFFHRFLPHVASILAPLNALSKETSKMKKREDHVPYHWDADHQNAFEEIKVIMAA